HCDPPPDYIKTKCDDPPEAGKPAEGTTNLKCETECNKLFQDAVRHCEKYCKSVSPLAVCFTAARAALIGCYAKSTEKDPDDVEGGTHEFEDVFKSGEKVCPKGKKK